MIELYSARRAAFDSVDFDNDVADPGLDLGARKSGGAGEPAPVPLGPQASDAIAEPPISPLAERARVDSALLLAMVEEVKYPDSLPEEVFVGADQGSGNGRGGADLDFINSINDAAGAQQFAAWQAGNQAAGGLSAAGVSFTLSPSGTPYVKGVGYASYAPGGGAVVTTTQNAGGGTSTTVANYSTPTAFAAATQTAGTGQSAGAGQPASAAPSDLDTIVVTAQQTPASPTASLQVNPLSSGIGASAQPVPEPPAAAPTPPPAPEETPEIVVTAKRGPLITYHGGLADGLTTTSYRTTSIPMPELQKLPDGSIAYGYYRLNAAETDADFVPVSALDEVGAVLSRAGGEALRLGGEAVGGAVDALSGLAQLGGNLLVSGAYQRSGLAGIVGATPSFVQAADARNAAVADSIVSGRVFTNTLYGIAGGIDAALLGNDLGPAARGLGGIAAGAGIGKAVSVVAGARLAPTSITREGISYPLTAPTLEARYRTAYTAAYESAYAKVQADIASGQLVNRTGMPQQLFEGQQVDGFARDIMVRYRASQGQTADEIRINQRLYTPSGSYTRPDVYIPGSGTILDGTLGMKVATDRQIVRFGDGNGGAPIAIVRPAARGGSYEIKK